MLRGIYTSALGMAVLTRRQEASANNLANVNTSGYKKETVVARSFPEMLIHRLNDPTVTTGTPPLVGNLSTGLQIHDIVTDYSAGFYKESGNPFELALMGEGYFVVNTPQGERYTRNGVFNLSPEGKLVTIDGYPVQGKKGEIVVGKGDFNVDESGQVFVNGKLVDKLHIVSFASPIVKEGSSLFRGEEPVEVENPKIAQGFVEESNVNAIEEMVNMINLMRAYEANQKVIQTEDSTLEKTVNEVGRI